MKTYAIIYSVGPGVLCHAEKQADALGFALAEFLSENRGRVPLAVVPEEIVEETKAAMLGGAVVKL